MLLLARTDTTAGFGDRAGAATATAVAASPTRGGSTATIAARRRVGCTISSFQTCERPRQQQYLSSGHESTESIGIDPDITIGLTSAPTVPSRHPGGRIRPSVPWPPRPRTRARG